MLETYKSKFHKNKFQYIITDNLGTIIESDDTHFPLKASSNLSELHPFFESIINLLQNKNETYQFSCVNFNDDKKIIDVTIHNQDKDISLIIIEDLTTHYNNYQLTAQTRNDSVINKQILELKNKYLLEKETFKNKFIANFSHQLRNPITAIGTFCNIINETNLNSEQQNYLNIILSANTDLKNRIDDVLDVAQISSGELILEKEVFSLKDFLDELVYAYKLLASKKGLNFNLHIDEKLPEFVEGDKFRLKQIIENLLANAITFTVEGSIGLHVSLNYTRAKKISLHVEVTDTGIGIKPSNHELIFERFTKVKSSIQSDDSIGLGLSIVKYLISQMGGNINIESKINEGTKIICNLSFGAASYDYKLRKKLLSTQKPNFDKKQNILLIEDSELTQLSVLKILALEGDFYLDIVSNIDSLTDTLLRQEFDLILISNKIQQYYAEELIKIIRKISREYKEVPKLVLMSEAPKSEVKRLIRSGAVDFIKKPFDKDTLLEKIYKYLG